MLLDASKKIKCHQVCHSRIRRCHLDALKHEWQTSGTADIDRSGVTSQRRGMETRLVFDTKSGEKALSDAVLPPCNRWLAERKQAILDLSGSARSVIIGKQCGLRCWSSFTKITLYMMAKIAWNSHLGCEWRFNRLIYGNLRKRIELFTHGFIFWDSSHC